LTISPEAISPEPLVLGHIEQRRSGGEVSFLVFLLEVTIFSEQLEFLAERAREIRQQLGLPAEKAESLVRLLPSEAAAYLQENGKLLRPAAREALTRYAAAQNLSL